MFMRRAFVQRQLMSNLRPGMQSGIAAAGHEPFFCTDTEVETCACATRTCVRRQLVSSLRPGVRSLTESSCGNTLPKSAPQSVKYTGEHACSSAGGMLRYQAEGAVDGVVVREDTARKRVAVVKVRLQGQNEMSQRALHPNYIWRSRRAGTRHQDQPRNPSKLPREDVCDGTQRHFQLGVRHTTEHATASPAGH